MIIIPIDFDETEEAAQKRAITMVSHGLYDRFSTSYEKRIEHATIGCMGEIAFEYLLKTRNIPYNTDRENFENRNADEFDFKINNYKLDIKVAKTDKAPLNSWTYGYPKQQIGMEKDIVVVGWVSGYQKKIGMYGWIFFNQINSYPLKCYNSFASFKYQTPNYEFPWADLNQNFDELFKFIDNTRK